MAASNMMSQYVSLGVESSDCRTLSNCNCCHNPRNRELVLEQSRCLDRGQWLWEITMCLGSNLDMPAVFLGSLKSQTNYLHEIHFLRISKRLCLWPTMSTILPLSCPVHHQNIWKSPLSYLTNYSLFKLILLGYSDFKKNSTQILLELLVLQTVSHFCSTCAVHANWSIPTSLHYHPTLLYCLGLL